MIQRSPITRLLLALFPFLAWIAFFYGIIFHFWLTVKIIVLPSLCLSLAACILGLFLHRASSKKKA